MIRDLAYHLGKGNKNPLLCKIYVKLFLSAFWGKAIRSIFYGRQALLLAEIVPDTKGKLGF